MLNLLQRDGAKIGNILKEAFTVLRSNPEMLTPVIRALAYQVVQTGLLFGSILMGVTGNVGTAFLGIVLYLAVLAYSPFFYNHQEMRLGLICFAAVRGKARSYAVAKKKAAALRKQIRFLAMIDIVMAPLRFRGSNKEGGVADALLALVLRGLTEVWDLVNHFAIPVIAATGASAGEIVERLKELRGEIPQTLIGVFGIDFVAQVVRAILLPFALVAFGVPFAVGYFFPEAFGPTIALGPVTMPTTMIVVSVGLMALASGVSKRIVTGAKILYFSLVYARLVDPAEVAPQLEGRMEVA